MPTPAGATFVDDWYDTEFGIDHVSRYFGGSSRVVERDGPIDHDITVQIDGTQGTAGDVTRHIMIVEGDYERLELSSSDHARQFGLLHSSPQPTSEIRWPTTTASQPTVSKVSKPAWSS